ncbi:MOSC domain-containing protein [Microvirga sp. 17 mud 1-3]|uniref:MOSC domain-containing protein n=1 Tax=Microvirga sp. 17 mud 1-3 TaxID=2082949 RepID=UPI000D6AFA5C|nr:MOSC domain-containing protein [Microvirga sp. 17 mud 1-3]AWM88087.1 MOSC domain-containing protein [Microvirga sp. 17 mud 1-3]
MRTAYRIEQLLTGSVAPLGPRGIPSGIAKRPRPDRVWLGPEGLTGDEQGDRRHHGGPEKAVHHYAFDHYATWRAALGERDVLFRPGAFGENLSTTGLTEAEVAIGDIFRAGEALIQVSQGRQPCWKLNARFGVPDMATRVQTSGRTGWYYRVIEPGFVEAGDELVLVERPVPSWTIERLWRALYVDKLNIPELTAMTALTLLSENWRKHAEKRLATGQVEDWSRRLVGDPGQAPAAPERS